MRYQNKCPICDFPSINDLFKGPTIGNGNKPFQQNSKCVFTKVVKDNPSVKELVDPSYHLNIKQCARCHHLFQFCVFDPEEELEYHRSFFKKNGIDQGYYNNSYFKIAEDIISELKFIFEINTFKTILDVGSSTGEFCFISKALGLDPYSIDPCIKTNEYLKENSIKCFENIKSINRTFEVIRVSHVLSHIHNNIKEFINQLIHLIDDNGLIYFVDHVYTDDLTPIKSPLLHVNLFSEKSFSKLIKKFPQLELIDGKSYIYKTYLFKCYRRVQCSAAQMNGPL